MLMLMHNTHSFVSQTSLFSFIIIHNNIQKQKSDWMLGRFQMDVEGGGWEKGAVPNFKYVHSKPGAS